MIDHPVELNSAAQRRGPSGLRELALWDNKELHPESLETQGHLTKSGQKSIFLRALRPNRTQS
jgi:hypothetical protein